MAEPETGPPPWIGGILPQDTAAQGPSCFLFAAHPNGPRWVVRDKMTMMDADDGRRVVAAYNATRGMSVESLETGIVAMLLECTVTLLGFYEISWPNGPSNVQLRELIAEAKGAALAAAKGGTTL